MSTTKIIRNKLIKIRIEEYVLFFGILLFSIFYFYFLRLNSKRVSSIFPEIMNMLGGMSYFIFVLYFFLLIVIFKLFRIFIKFILLLPKSEKNNIYNNNKNCYSIKINTIKSKLSGIIPLSRIFLGLTIFSLFSIGMLNLWRSSLKEMLINEILNESDRYLFGIYPFIWLQNDSSFFRNFDLFILISFQSLAVVMSLTLFILYIGGKRKFVSWYIMSFVISLIISQPLWYFFPSNSPQNAFLRNVYGKEMKSNIERLVKDYRPTGIVSTFQDKINDLQKANPPISTMPSMHATWSIIIALVAFKYNKRLLFLFFPWAIFSIIGTVYLAQHYLIDVIIAFPIAFLALLISYFLIKLENKYYHHPAQDELEGKFKENIRKEFKKIFIIKKLIKSLVLKRGIHLEQKVLVEEFLE